MKREEQTAKSEVEVEAGAARPGEMSEAELAGVAGGLSHSGGANFLMGDGSVKPVGLLLPAVQKAR